MVLIASALALLAVWFAFVWWRRRRLPKTRWFLRVAAVSGVATLIALEAGWFVTEVGRQPWIVYRVMRTTEAVTGAGGIPVGYATLAIVYLGLTAAVVWVLRRLGRAPLDAPDAPAAHAPV